MGKNYKYSVMLAMALLLSAAVTHVSAGPCGDQPCEPGEPAGLMDGSPPGLERGEGLPPGLNRRDSFEDRDFVYGQKRQRRADKNRRREHRRIEIYSRQGDDQDDHYAQFDDNDQGLIGPTEALTQALAAVPGGKALGVKLLKGQTPMYAVKLRVRGKVRRILVDARTAQVLGE